METFWRETRSLEILISFVRQDHPSFRYRLWIEVTSGYCPAFSVALQSPRLRVSLLGVPTADHRADIKLEASESRTQAFAKGRVPKR